MRNLIGTVQDYAIALFTAVLLGSPVVAIGGFIGCIACEDGYCIAKKADLELATRTGAEVFLALVCLGIMSDAFMIPDCRKTRIGLGGSEKRKNIDSLSK